MLIRGDGAVRLVFTDLWLGRLAVSEFEGRGCTQERSFFHPLTINGRFDVTQSRCSVCFFYCGFF